MPISVAAVACALVFGAPTARANVIYEYTGQLFNTFVGASNPYTASDSVHGTFTVASALAPNLVEADLSGQILSFVFNDFAESHAPITSEFLGEYYFKPQISTDAAGGITFWSLGFADRLLTHVISSSHTNRWSGDLKLVVGPSNVSAYDGAARWNFGAPGTWSSRASAVPEPSGLVLLCTGIVVVGASLRRSQQSRSRYSVGMAR